MTEEEISTRMAQLQRQIGDAVLSGDNDSTPVAILIAACVNIVGHLADASKLHQQTAGLLRDCADHLQAMGQAAESACVH